MILNPETPAILFPAISLLLLAYTNRFLALSQLIRSLNKDFESLQSIKTLSQIKHLQLRVFFIQLMQALGVTALILCTFSIFALLMDSMRWGLILFIASLCVFAASIVCSLIEILMSSRALNILLSDIKIKSP